MQANTRLRPLRVDDAEEILAAFSSDPGMARQGTVRDLGEAEAYARRLTSPDGVHVAWAVVGDDDRLVGLVVVTVDTANRNGWFSYWMHPVHRGTGRTGRTAAAVANWALSEGGMERLELGHRANNPASGAVARRAGFIQEGVERAKFLMDGERIDVLTYGRLRTDPWADSGGLSVSG